MVIYKIGTTLIQLGDIKSFVLHHSIILNQYFKKTAREVESGHQFCALHVLLCLSHCILLEQDAARVPSWAVLF